MMFAVHTDFAGLRAAALELLEAERTREERARVARKAEGAANRERMLEAAKPKLTFAAAYYDRVLYLAGLDSLSLPPGRLRRAQWLGLRALEAARAEHERQHPPCPQCGAGLDRPGALACRCGWRRPAKERAA